MANEIIKFNLNDLFYRQDVINLLSKKSFYEKILNLESDGYNYTIEYSLHENAFTKDNVFRKHRINDKIFLKFDTLHYKDTVNLKLCDFENVINEIKKINSGIIRFLQAKKIEKCEFNLDISITSNDNFMYYFNKFDTFKSGFSILVFINICQMFYLGEENKDGFKVNKFNSSDILHLIKSDFNLSELINKAKNKPDSNFPVLGSEYNYGGMKFMFLENLILLSERLNNYYRVIEFKTFELIEKKLMYTKMGL